MQLCSRLYVIGLLSIACLAGCSSDSTSGIPGATPAESSPGSQPDLQSPSQSVGTATQAERIMAALNGIKPEITVLSDHASLGIPVVFLYDDQMSQAEMISALGKLQNVKGVDFVVHIFGCADAVLEMLPNLPGLKGLTANLTKDVTRVGIGRLAQLTQLRLLEIAGYSGGEEEWNHEKSKAVDYTFLRNFAELRELKLEFLSLQDAPRDFLPALKSLGRLEIRMCQLKNGELANLNALTMLEHLSLYGNEELDDGVCRGLAEMPRLKTLDLSFTGITDATLAHLTQAKNLEVLRVLGTKIVGDGFRHFADHTQIRELRVSDCHSLTGAGLAAFAKCGELKELDLNFTRAGNAGLAEVEMLASLTTLLLPTYGSPNAAVVPPDYLDDTGLQHVAALKNLEVLRVCGAGITDAGLAKLNALTKLREFHVTYCPKVTGAGFAAWTDIPNLESLDLEHSSFSDDATRYLVGFKALTRIKFPENSISDAAVPNLIQLPKLKEIYAGSKLTEKGRGQLRQAIGGVTIY